MILDVKNLRVTFRQRERRGQPPVVDGLSLQIRAGECVALVGESGSGKSVTARSLIGLAGSGARLETDRFRLQGRDLSHLRDRQWRRIRGNQVGFVLQDALGSLDPLRPIGREIADSLRLHTRLSPAERTNRVRELLTSVGMPEPDQRMRQRPGELSGGLRQRALIAAAIAAQPDLLIADEPTTALDQSVQRQVLDLLAGLQASGMAVVVISHDLALVQRIADRVLVMKDGQVVEQGTASEVLSNPRHSYTRALLAAVPAGRARGERLSIASAPPSAIALREAPLADAALRDGSPAALRETPLAVAPIDSSLPATQVLSAREVTKDFRTPDRIPLRAVDAVSLDLHRGQTLGLVGESGSGKTTLARILLGLLPPDAGDVTLAGAPWSDLRENDRRPLRSRIGAVYQDPLGSFDPRMTVERILIDAISGGHTTRADRNRRKLRSVQYAQPTTAGRYGRRVDELLDSVGLSRDILSSRPLHLSGGQRQRVAIARAIAPGPEIIICDEPVSALDVSVQAQVLDLLDDLQAEFGLSYLFISHDLDVVQHMSDTVAVMLSGRIVEVGSPEAVLTQPTHEYTQQLVGGAR